MDRAIIVPREMPPQTLLFLGRGQIGDQSSAKNCFRGCTKQIEHRTFEISITVDVLHFQFLPVVFELVRQE
jgi:hypothetical protein